MSRRRTIEGMIASETTPTDVMTTYFDSWRAKDFETLRSVLDDAATFAGPLGAAANAEECARGLEGMSQIMTDIVVEKMLTDGTDVLTWFQLHTNVAPPTAVCNWSRVEDGKVVQIRATFDPREILAAGS
jgi:SnoaL-like protein